MKPDLNEFVKNLSFADILRTYKTDRVFEMSLLLNGKRRKATIRFNDNEEINIRFGDDTTIGFPPPTMSAIYGAFILMIKEKVYLNALTDEKTLEKIIKLSEENNED